MNSEQKQAQVYKGMLGTGPYAFQQQYQRALSARLTRKLDEVIMTQQGIGDVNSDERGSGARYNSGKPRLELIPAHVWLAWNEYATIHEGDGFLDSLDDWQRGDLPAADLLVHFSPQCMEEAARVFEYGAQKYAAWNWAKGMDWSVPVGCILRHWLAIQREEMIDPESGRSHWGHVACNVIMLVHFEETYPEGDDRPPAACWGEDGPLDRLRSLLGTIPPWGECAEGQER